MSDFSDPFEGLSRQELLWLAGILKDACRERLEKNLVSQAIEDRLYRRGPVEGRSDPRPFLQIWEPRYRKFLDAATTLHSALQAGEAKSVAESLRAHVASAPVVKRYGPSAAVASQHRAMIDGDGANPRRKSRSR